MAETRGDHAVKGNFNVSGNAKFNKGLDSPYLEVIDQKVSGTAGGTFDGHDGAVAAWRTRDLTNVVFDDFATSVTVAASAGDGGDITLERGVYYAEVSCPALNVNEHVARIADVTDNPGPQGETVVLGTTEFAADTSQWITSTDVDQTVGLNILNAATSQTRSLITGRFQLTSQRTLEIQHRCTTTQTTDGFGSDGAFYETNNVYTVVKMWQVRDDL